MADAAITPTVDSWAVAIHRSSQDHSPLGSGFVVDRRHVLTCAHVLVDDNGKALDEVWVAFPKAGVSKSDRRRSIKIARDTSDAAIDVVMLTLAEPVPVTVTPAVVRRVDGKSLCDSGWWSFGFPGGDADGSVATGRIAHELAYGQVLLETQSKYKIEHGFSGGPVWSPGYGAVIGMVTKRGQDGDGQALTLHQLDQGLPHFQIANRAKWGAKDADDVALGAWGWSLVTDPESGQHWLPKARGTLNDRESDRFRGRSTALKAITAWLDRAKADGRILVVTGSPGVGKSAVLGRVITTADEDIRKELPDDDQGILATPGSVQCAVHVKGKNAIEVAIEIARGASVALPKKPSDVVQGMKRRLGGTHSGFNLVIDALDEAVSPTQARILVDEVLLPLARECAVAGVQVIVGTRRSDDNGDLLGRFVPAAVVVDLDTARYFAESDLADYARVTLQRASAETSSRPYLDERVARPVADRIAALSERNFLVAGLVARSYGRSEGPAIDPAQVSFTPTVGAALESYLDSLGSVGRVPPMLLLSVLAHAEAPGLPVSLWRAGVAAFGGAVTEQELLAFAHGAAANFLVESGADRAKPVFRLFHQALNDALLPGQGRDANEQKLLRAWLYYGRATGWQSGEDYLRRSLPTHAVRAHEVDLVLEDDSYLLYADLRRLTPVADRAGTPLGKARAALLQRTPLAADAGPAERSAMFSVVEKLDGLDSALAIDPGADYRALWARTPPRLERTVLEGHADSVFAVCSIAAGRRTLLVSGGEDGTVRLWDPTTGQLDRMIQLHNDSVRDVCAVDVDGVAMLASAGQDGAILICDPRTGTMEQVLTGHTDWVRAVCSVFDGTRTWLASASDDRTVRIWDPTTGKCERVLSGHLGWVTALCAVPDGPRSLIASAGYEGVIRLWDPLTGDHTEQTLDPQAGWVTALCAVRADHGPMVASAGYDGVVRIWDITTGEVATRFPGGRRPLTGLCTVEVNGAEMLAVTSEGGDIQLCDPVAGTVSSILTGHTDRIRKVCAVRVDRRSLLASAGDDGTVRVWDPATGQADQVMDGGRIGPVYDMCLVPRPDSNLLATTAPDGSVRLWAPETGDERYELPGHPLGVTNVCAFSSDSRFELAVASGDNKVRLWDLDGGQIDHMLDASVTVTVVCTVSTGRRELLATAGEDESVWLWDADRNVVDRALGSLMSGQVTAMCPITGDGGYETLAWATDDGTLRLWDTVERRPVWERHAHHQEITSICQLRVGGRRLIASTSTDQTIRLWDPDTGVPRTEVLRGHTGPVRDLCALPAAGGDLLISVGDDRTVRIWDPATGELRQVIPVHHAGVSCAYDSGLLFVGLDVGLLTLVVSG